MVKKQRLSKLQKVILQEMALRRGRPIEENPRDMDFFSAVRRSFPSLSNRSYYRSLQNLEEKGALKLHYSAGVLSSFELSEEARAFLWRPSFSR